MPRSRLDFFPCSYSLQRNLRVQLSALKLFLSVLPISCFLYVAPEKAEFVLSCQEYQSCQQ